MPSVSMPLENCILLFIISIIVIFVLVQSHRKLLFTHLSMFLYHSDVSIAPAH